MYILTPALMLYFEISYGTIKFRIKLYLRDMLDTLTDVDNED